MEGSFSEQSASLPGRPPEAMADLRTVSRPCGRPSRARAALRALSMILRAMEGLVLKLVFELFPDDALHDAIDFAVTQLGLRLALEAGLGDFYGNDRCEAFAHVVAADRGVLVLHDVVGLCVIVDHAGEGGAGNRSGVCAPFDVVNGVGVGVELVRCSCRCIAGRYRRQF